jgi:hypothetical protein
VSVALLAIIVLSGMATTASGSRATKRKSPTDDTLEKMVREITDLESLLRGPTEMTVNKRISKENELREKRIQRNNKQAKAKIKAAEDERRQAIKAAEDERRQANFNRANGTPPSLKR